MADKNSKRCFRIFTISDYEAEEKWLRDMANAGWMLKKFSIPGIYTFEKIEPADIVFRLEFREKSFKDDPEYQALLEDYGWSYLLSCNQFCYFYKKADADERSNEIFSDNLSRLEMVRTITRRRLLPITVIFFCCVLPGINREFEREATSAILLGFWAVMLVLYTGIILHCSITLSRLGKKYKQQ